VTFRILHAGCGSEPAAFDLFINDVLAGSASSTLACDCTGDELVVTFSDAETLALVDPNLCNTFRVTASDQGATTRLGFVQVVLETTDGTQERCLFDGSVANPSPTCTARPLCDPPGFSENVAVVEGTLCPVCGDGATDSANPDLDGDRIGNTCDDADAALAISRARVDGNTSTGPPDGSITARGSVLRASPDDHLDAAGGIAVRITDGLSLDQTFLWAASDCVQLDSGSITCRSPDGQWIGYFTVRSGSPGRYSFRLGFGGVSSAPPFSSPLTVRVIDHPPQAVVGIDRVGTVANCTVTNNSIRCLGP
jgi:hypothetical protein